MSCDKFREIMLEVILGDQNIDEHAGLLQHIKQCEDCRLEYDQLGTAVGTIKPLPDESLSPMEKLELENKIYKARLSKLSTGNINKHVFLKRIAAIAAAFLFFILGFSSRPFYQNRFDLKEMASTEKRIEDVIRRQIAGSSGQRVSPRGLLLIAKGKKAIEQHEQIPAKR